jgi:hypothetical protein
MASAMATSEEVPAGPASPLEKDVPVVAPKAADGRDSSWNSDDDSFFFFFCLSFISLPFWFGSVFCYS